MKRSSRSTLQHQFYSEECVHGMSLSFTSYVIGTDLRAQRIRLGFDEYNRIANTVKIVGFTLCVSGHKLQPFFQMVNNNYSACTEEPGTFCCHNTDRPRTEHEYGIT